MRRSRAPGSVLPRERWWELYGDAELAALEAQVVINNQTVLAAEARVRQAQAQIDVARAPSFLAGECLRHQREAGASASWEIDLWGRIRRSVEASTAAAEASADDLAAATLSIQAQIAQDYFLLRVQDAQIRLLQESAARYERSLQLTRNQYAVGVASRGDVAQAEAQLMSTRAQALEAEVDRAQFEHAIAILIGKAPADFSIAATTATLQVPAVPSALPSELLVRRPDIASAERRMAAANAQIGVAQAAFYPSARLFAGGGIDISFAGGIALAQFLLDGGLREAQKAQASAAYDETIANYRQTVLARAPRRRGQSRRAAHPRKRSRGARRRGEGVARIGDDHEQPIPRRHRDVSLRRRRAGRGARQRTRRPRHPRRGAWSRA